MAVKHTINGIEFSDIKTSNKSFNPLVHVNSGGNSTEDLNEQYGVGGDLPTIVNAVEIDWNGAKPGMGEDSTIGITTTGELMKGVYSPMFAKAA